MVFAAELYYDGEVDRRTEAKMSAAFTIRLDDETLGALDQLAQKTERSRHSIVNQAIADYVAQNAWRIDRIEAGLAAADAGDFASDQDIARLRQKFIADR